MEMKLELVPVPVGNIDRAKAFYVDRLGFAEDVDVRLTPPGSACSIVLGAGLPLIAMEPGSIRASPGSQRHRRGAAVADRQGRRGRRDRGARRRGQVRRLQRPGGELLDAAGDAMEIPGMVLG